MNRTKSSLYAFCSFGIGEDALLNDGEIRKKILRYLYEELEYSGCREIRVSGGVDHGHVAFKYLPSKSLSEVLRHAKMTSSTEANKAHILEGSFHWGERFWAWSYSSFQAEVVKMVMDNQEVNDSRMNVTI